MRDVTLCFLTKQKQSQVDQICLAMKKRGFGANRWNGVGGKIKKDAGESIKQAMAREALEEISVKIKNFYKVAELTFIFPHQKDWNQLVHTYFTKEWVGEPEESEEMKPEWFSVKKIPFDSMWPDDIYWLPKVLKKKLVKAKFVFGKNDVVLEKDIKIVKGF